MMGGGTTGGSNGAPRPHLHRHLCLALPDLAVDLLLGVVQMLRIMRVISTGTRIERPYNDITVLTS